MYGYCPKCGALVSETDFNPKKGKCMVCVAKDTQEEHTLEEVAKIIDKWADKVKKEAFDENGILKPDYFKKKTEVEP